jgi:hypothetical protein
VRSGSQIRSTRATGSLADTVHRIPAAAQPTLTMCSAEKPAVPKNCKRAQVDVQRPAGAQVRGDESAELFGVRRVQVAGEGDRHMVVVPRHHSASESRGNGFGGHRDPPSIAAKARGSRQVSSSDKARQFDVSWFGCELNL